jgi:pyruvate/2-oxoglutarate dehydrogenase complex dihydrolipoamide acyltransferase (E2) component
MQTKANRRGEVEVRKFVNMNFTVDERICDGYNLARSFDLFIDYLESPEKLYDPET